MEGYVLRQFAHRLVSHPIVYDQVQYLVGGNVIQQHMQACLAAIHKPTTVLDLGGGTGVMRHLWSKLHTMSAWTLTTRN